jgi:hypothetical protein
VGLSGNVEPIFEETFDLFLLEKWVNQRLASSLLKDFTWRLLYKLPAWSIGPSPL